MSFWSWLSAREKRPFSVSSCSSAALVAMSPRGGDAPRRRRCRSAGALGRGPAGRTAVAAVHAHRAPHDEAQEGRRQGPHGKVAQRGQELSPRTRTNTMAAWRPRPTRGNDHLTEGGAAGGLGGGIGKRGHLFSLLGVTPHFPFNLAETSKLAPAGFFAGGLGGGGPPQRRAPCPPS